MMLQASPESTTLKLPGRKMEAPKSDRAKEIAKSREEMLSLLHDMPESDYELSLTDIVDGKSGGAAEKDAQKDQEVVSSSAGGEKNSHRGKVRKRSNSGKSLRCNSDGVLLNFYTPTLLTRSLTTPRGKPMTMSRTSSISSSKRENEKALKFMGCWSLLWDRRWGKSKILHQEQEQEQEQEQNQFEFDCTREENPNSNSKAGKSR